MTTQSLSIVISLLLLAFTATAQAPQRMSFQAVVRDASGKLVAEHPVGMRLSILRGSANGTVVFSETHQPKTNANGLASLVYMVYFPDGTPYLDFKDKLYHVRAVRRF